MRKTKLCYVQNVIKILPSYFLKKAMKKETIKNLKDYAIIVKKQGIDPLETLYRQNDVLAHDPVSMEEMKKQFENIFKDFAENISLDDINKIDGAFTFGTDNIDEEDLDDSEKPHIAGAAIPLGSIFSSLLNGDDDPNLESQEELASQSNSRKKIKVVKNKTKRKNILIPMELT